VERTLNYEHVDQFSVGWMDGKMIDWSVQLFGWSNYWLIGWLVG